jgi:hypothetical protein
MYTAPFKYHTPGSVDEAIALLTRHGDEAKLLAGGHSLIPVMKLRLAQPAHLIDLRKVTTLVGVREERNAIVVGAMTTYAAVEASDVVRGKLPMLAEAIRLIGDPQVRNRGTVGGSLAHADPGADLPAVALALDAELRIRGSGGERTVRAAEFFVGLSSGLSWLAWACGIPVVMISGFTHPTNEFATPYRIINFHTCNSCWNDPRHRFDHKDFLWCPRHKDTPRQFECTRLIAAEHVKSVIRTIPGFGSASAR